ncbi:MAG: sterol desaturase family protein [Verrucomicrobiaceae bacterium]|nr:sterol desaturase family protein [Verrucomicrobiaceae bacterium]
MKERSIIEMTISLLLLASIFFVVERVLGKGRKQPIFRKGWVTDVIYWFATPLLTKNLVRFALIAPLLLLVAAQVTDVEALKSMKYTGFGPLSRQPLWLQAIQVYIIGDFMGYWSHRLFHRGRWWPFHAVHHSTEELDWLGSLRVHPINDLVNKLAQATPILLLGYHPLVTASSAVFLTFYAIFLHANVNWDFGPLRSIIATPVFHRWHHSKEREAWDKNFAGLFPVWDIVFGTYYMPKGRYPENFGIHEEMPKGYLGQLIAPFRWKRNS